MLNQINANPLADMADDDFGPVDLEAAREASKRQKFPKREETARAEELHSEKCGDCNGTGIYPLPSKYGAVCIRCNGKGVRLFKQPKAKRDANRIASAERKARKMVDNLASFEAAHPDIAAWWIDSTFPFAISLREAVQKYGELTERQMLAAQNSAAKLAATKAERAVQVAMRQAEAKVITTEALEAAFAHAKSKGVQRPKITLAGLTFSPAPATGANAGAIYAKDRESDTYLGKAIGGKFVRSRDCSALQEQQVLDVCADPKQAAIAYGKQFGICCVCNRTLTDPTSVEAGIGPICADRMGW